MENVLLIGKKHMHVQQDCHHTDFDIFICSVSSPFFFVSETWFSFVFAVKEGGRLVGDTG